MTLREEMQYITNNAIRSVLPDQAVRRALEGWEFPEGRLFVVSAGKAAWQMAQAAEAVLGDRICGGVVCTKYGHVKGKLDHFTCYEGGHPIPDANSYKATQAALELTADLSAKDTVLFLLSGGGSALFEKPLLPAEQLADITQQLLACGADIVEINTIRKRLSAVKGGRFAQHCHPAHIQSIILSDILGDPIDMIASGPAYPDASTCADAFRILEKYPLRVEDSVRALLQVETPKHLENVTTQVIGSVSQLCEAAKKACEELGYEAVILTDRLSTQAREAGRFLASIARTHRDRTRSVALIAGGETRVVVTGSGLGGRNQELALAGAPELSGLENTALFSFGSDGTDGPTDAAGGFVDGNTYSALRALDLDVEEILNRNDSYHALQAVDGLILTGPTGTNVNDAAVLLMRA